MSSKPTLLYLKVRGRGELTRLVCAEAGLDYDEHPVTRGTPPQHGRPTDFNELRATGALPFDAVPVWEEPDGFRLAQSDAIAKHVARGHDLLGRTPREAAECDQMIGVYEDVRAELRKVFLAAPEQRAAARAELVDNALPRWLGFLDRLLARNQDGTGFLVGDRVSIADLACWYLLEMAHDNGLDALLAPHPRLVAYAARIAARPRIAAWIGSPRRYPPVLLPT